MTLTAEPDDFAAMSAELGLSIALGDGHLDVRLQVHGVPVLVEIAVLVVDGGLDLNVVKATAAGLGLFGEVRHQANLAMIEKAVGYPRIGLAYNDRGNLTLTALDLTFLSVTIQPARLTAEANP